MAGAAWYGEAQRGLARQGEVGVGEAWQAGFGSARRGKACLVKAMSGVIRHGMAWQVWFGEMSCGLVSQGMAW